MILESIDESRFVESQTQLSDTNVVETIDFEKLTQSRSSEYHQLQKTYVPDYSYSTSDTAISQQYYTSPTQAPDTNTVQAGFIDESIIPDEYDVTRLQKKYIPSEKNNKMFNPIDDIFASSEESMSLIALLLFA